MFCSFPILDVIFYQQATLCWRISIMLHVITLNSYANDSVPDSASTWNTFGREGQIGTWKLNFCTGKPLPEGGRWIPPAHHAGCCLLEWGHWRGHWSLPHHGFLRIESKLCFLIIISTTTLFTSSWGCPQVMEDIAHCTQKLRRSHEMSPKLALETPLGWQKIHKDTRNASLWLEMSCILCFKQRFEM